MADEEKPAPSDTEDDPTEPKDDAEAAKWKALSRKHEKQAKELADRLAQLEDKDKTESERLTSKVAQLEKDLATATARADRFEVAVEKGLDMVRAKRLTGTTREELEADADELQTWQAGTEKPVPAKPTADLRGGGDPTEEPSDTADIRTVVDSIPRGV